ncbi:hypothetical protein SESBI_31589 [Sesbania bispinosa]|nr:hypothetical protein SESBI_31589 [Sesbania bispinosa]
MTSFKYELMWDEHPDCKNVIARGWQEPAKEDFAWGRVLSGVLSGARSYKRAILNWHKQTFLNATKEIPKLKAKLLQLQNAANKDDNLEEIKNNKKQLQALWQQEENYWGQRSRLKWIKWGDHNTKFFHATTVQRRGRNMIVHAHKG